MFSFIACICCIAVAIYDFYIGLYGWGLTQTALAAINIPFAIQWLMAIF